MSQLYVTNNEPKLWFGVGDCRCEHCNIPLLEDGFFVVVWERKRHYKNMFFCVGCVKDHKKYSLSEHPIREVMVNRCRFKAERPKGVNVFVPFPLEFQKSPNLSVFDTEKLVSHCEDKDLTVLSSRDLLEDNNKKLLGDKK